MMNGHEDAEVQRLIIESLQKEIAQLKQDKEDLGKEDQQYDGPVHLWFELSYAQYLTVPRLALQSMPLGWQVRFARCLQELDEKLEWRPTEGRYWVKLKDDKGRYVRDKLEDYRRAPLMKLK